MRIFHINMHLKWGGQPNRVLETARGLRDRGHEVCVSAPRGAMLIDRARELGIETFDQVELRRGFHPLAMRRDVVALRRHFEERRYDIVDTHGSQDTWAACLAMRGLQRRPGFVRTRHNIFPVSRNPFNRWLYAQVDHVVTISPQVVPLMEGLVPVDRFTPIYSAPDPTRFNVGDCRDAVRRELGFEPEDEVVGVVARLAPEKGHSHLLDAAPHILDARPRARFLFVGTGRSLPSLQAQVTRLRLDDRVTFTGFREDVPRLLQAMDVFVLPPVSGESLGTSILEAFLMHRPVVATDVGGVRESVVHGETGLLVPPGDHEALARAIVEMLADRPRATALAAAGKARVESLFTLDNIARQTEEVYGKVLGGRA